MKLSDCKKCKHHVELRNYQVLCNYGGSLSSMATAIDEKAGDYKVLACPLDNKK
ncbi:MAG TPA: hypothetical protein PKX79_03420 [Spirochaetota bacterium]|jgi:hypothetical protein|nr:hypothetical protein [Spirochaetota bacterium]HOK01688.1 hypothetical protein [Spirochaetota bacterium]HOK91839.1 hypothetical protein [Spirochaetota bacterium]HON15269.1 hypothetical protein [Spirochaetota bacterium]HOQ11749.1 hypothetical protein [Spirochaetota bacterium]